MGKFKSYAGLGLVLAPWLVLWPIVRFFPLSLSSLPLFSSLTNRGVVASFTPFTLIEITHHLSIDPTPHPRLVRRVIRTLLGSTEVDPYSPMVCGFVGRSGFEWEIGAGWDEGQAIGK